MTIRLALFSSCLCAVMTAAACSTTPSLVTSTDSGTDAGGPDVRPDTALPGMDSGDAPTDTGREGDSALVGDATTDPGAIDGPADATGCSPWKTLCGGACVDLASDPANCGACGRDCMTSRYGPLCSGGICSGLCAPSATRCGDRCYDLRTDPDHCGACDHACPAGQRCDRGTCAATCSALVDCHGLCRDLDTDPTACGACGAACPQDIECVTGHCVGSCEWPFYGTFLCYGTCVNVRDDLANCGACGIACPAGVLCIDGRCAAPHDAGLDVTSFGDGSNDGHVDAATCDADLLHDWLNCGACGVRCCGGPWCTVGVCGAEGPTGFTACPGPADAGCTGPVAVDLAVDSVNCGSCGHACTPAQVCVAGACQALAPADGGG